MKLLVLCVCLAFCAVQSLDNGLARTPPMGWLSWERYRCNVDCDNDPDNCISENLYKQMADHMAKDGFKDAGYEYINIDDCWMSKERDANGTLVPDPKRFPSGMKALADYIHNLGLKIGIYEDFGTETCGGYPGSKFYLEKDADTFASWGIDSLKLDGCYTDIEDIPIGYPIMTKFLNQTGRRILYSCSWPAYIVFNKKVPDYKSIAQNCNLWRNYADIDDSWDSVKGIINFYAKDEGNFSKVAGPGNFNDPDMLIIGNFGLSPSEEKAQMAMWSIMAAPLYMSNDLRNVRNSSKALLLNKNAIAINQDPLGIQGTLVMGIGDIQFWAKPLSEKGSAAIAVLNLGTGGTGSYIKLTSDMFKLDDPNGYRVVDVFTGASVGSFSTSTSLMIHVNPSDVFFAVAQLKSSSLKFKPMHKY